jgi:hypothetical protein
MYCAVVFLRKDDKPVVAFVVVDDEEEEEEEDFESVTVGSLIKISLRS